MKRTELIKTNFPLPFVKTNITLGHMDYCDVSPCAQKCPAAAGYSLNKLSVMCNVVSPQVKTTKCARRPYPLLKPFRYGKEMGQLPFKLKQAGMLQVSALLRYRITIH